MPRRSGRAIASSFFNKILCCWCIPHRVKRHKTALYRILGDDSFIGCILKTISGFLGGILISFALYVLLVHQLNYSNYLSMIVCAAIGSVLSITMSFSTFSRCLTLLALPGLFTKHARNAIYIFIFILVITHPVPNFETNVNVLVDSMTCSQAKGKSEMESVAKKVIEPLTGIINVVKAVIATIKQIVEEIRAGYMRVKQMFQAIYDGIQNAFSWLNGMADLCTENAFKPYKQCTSAFEDAYENCLAVTWWIFRWLCKIVPAFQGVCDIAKLLVILCELPQRIADSFTTIVVAPILEIIKWIHDMFYFDVSLFHEYRLTLNESQSVDQIREKVRNELKDQFKIVDTLKTVGYMSLLLMLGFLVVSSVHYLFNYLRRFKFDNYFISWVLLDIDFNLRKGGRETVMPLSKDEEKSYVKPGDVFLARKEVAHLATNVLAFVINALQVSFFLICDYGLYSIIEVVERKADQVSSEKLGNQGFVKMHVVGNSSMSDIYRTMITAFDPEAQGPTANDFSGQSLKLCIPHPHKPDYGVYRTIGILLGFCLFTSVFGVYIKRFRHLFAAICYPHREKLRAAWLVRHILQERVNYFGFFHKTIREINTTENKNKKRRLGLKLKKKSRALTFLFEMVGVKTMRYCYNCGAPQGRYGVNRLIKCSEKDCAAFYCRQCFEDIDYRCTVCKGPSEYGNLVDFSDERDSSDDDVLWLKEMEKGDRYAEMLLKFERELQDNECDPLYKGLKERPIASDLSD